MSGRRRYAKRLSQEETKSIIKSRIKLNHLFLWKAYNKQDSWKAVAEDAGVDIDVVALKKKWGNLEAIYKKLVENPTGNPGGHLKADNWPYFNDMHEWAFGGYSMHPPYLLSSEEGPSTSYMLDDEQDQEDETEEAQEDVPEEEQEDAEEEAQEDAEEEAQEDAEEEAEEDAEEEAQEDAEEEAQEDVQEESGSAISAMSPLPPQTLSMSSGSRGSRKRKKRQKTSLEEMLERSERLEKKMNAMYEGISVIFKDKYNIILEESDSE